MLLKTTARFSRVTLLSSGFALGLALSAEPAPVHAQALQNEVFGSDDWGSKNDERAPECESLNSDHRDLTQQMYQSRDPKANRQLARERAPIHEQLIDCLAQALKGKATENVGGGPTTYPDPQPVSDPSPQLPGGVDTGPKKQAPTKKTPPHRSAPPTQAKPYKEVLYGEGSIWWTENGKPFRLKYKLTLDLDAAIGVQAVTNTKIEGRDKVRYHQGKAVIVSFKGKRISAT